MRGYKDNQKERGIAIIVARDIITRICPRT
jgi:hypothetical protein